MTEKEIESNPRHRNPRSLKETFDKTIEMFDKDQLESKVNTEDLEAVEDVAKDESFVVEKQDKTMPIENAGDPELEKYPEMDRFAKEHEFPEEVHDVGQKVRGMGKVAKTDATADAKGE